MSASGPTIELVARVAGSDAASWVAERVEVASVVEERSGRRHASRATIAHALALVLFADLCGEVPSAAAYVEDQHRAGRRVVLDHGAVRTVDVACGAIPTGPAQVTRLLGPLGYELAETYDLASLRMTGQAWRHVDHPESVPQWFVSELHLDRFEPDVQAAAAALFGHSTDALAPHHHDLLASLAADRRLPTDLAADLLGALRRAFSRRHPAPTDRDHDRFLAVSPELAWIATEGTAANHWTDRVADVAATAAAERTAGRPIKDRVEVSGSGRVRQTAHRAATVARRFRTVEGPTVERDVPGSFFEMIERRPLPDGGLDLAFDAANATGIFAMTRPTAP
jgi:hypothetical protein